jgi:hypothetical protein
MTQDNRVSDLIRDLVVSMKALQPREKYFPPREELSPIVDIEAYLTAKYRDKPLPTLSPELRKKLGACIPRIEE